MSEFEFKLSHQAWVFEEDENQVFRALEIADGRYQISWKDNEGNMREVFYSFEDVLLELAEEYWVVIENYNEDDFKRKGRLDI